MPNVAASWVRSSRAGIYILVLLLLVAVAFGAKLRLRGIFACPASYAGTSYLSDCNALNYGDYDHGAFWFGLEPRTRRAAADANVLMLGNSRMQFGFSSPVTVQWFGQRSIPFFMMGFSHYESVTFVTPILAKVQPHADAYVINADRFFADWLSPAAQRILYERDARARYDEKRFWQGPHRMLCGLMPGLCGHELAVYRNASNGMWTTSGRLPHEPAVIGEATADESGRWPRYIELAREFVARLPVDRRCIIVTIVPTRETRRTEAEAIAHAIGVPFVAPHVDGLTTFDGSHLDVASASRWSAAFLDAAGPLIEGCVYGKASGAG